MDSLGMKKMRCCPLQKPNTRWWRSLLQTMWWRQKSKKKWRRNWPSTITEPLLHLENNRGKTESLEELLFCPKTRVSAAGLPAPCHLTGALLVVAVPLAMVAGTRTAAKKLVDGKIRRPSIAVLSGSSEKVQRRYLPLVQEDSCHGNSGQKGVVKLSKAPKRTSASPCLGSKNLPQAILLAAQRESKVPLPPLWSQEETKRGLCVSIPCLSTGHLTTQREKPQICFQTPGLNGTVIPWAGCHKDVEYNTYFLWVIQDRDSKR